MRDKGRIFPFLQKIGNEWSKMPDQRFAQLLLNFFNWLEKQGRDPFYLEDDELLLLFDSYISIFVDL